MAQTRAPVLQKGTDFGTERYLIYTHPALIHRSTRRITLPHTIKLIDGSWTPAGVPRSSDNHMSNTKTRQQERQADARRRKNADSAVEYFKSAIPTKFNGKAASINKIRASARPLVTAKSLVAAYVKAGLSINDTNSFSLSDVEELRVWLVRRDGVIDRPHASILHKMDVLIAKDEMDEKAFVKMAGAVKSMPCAYPKPERLERPKKPKVVQPRLPYLDRLTWSGSPWNTMNF
jgi:hypothetical protein